MVFEPSKIKLSCWLMAVHLMCASKKGMSAHQIHRMIGVTYKTTWFMCHRQRDAMMSDGGIIGGGEAVELDETHCGMSREKSKGAHGYDHKMKIASLVERDGNNSSIQMPKVTAATLGPILKGKIAAKAR